MNPENLKKLCTKSVDLNHVPGGIPDLTSMDVAAALRHLDTIQCELLLVKYAGRHPVRLAGAWQGVVRGMFPALPTREAMHLAAYTLQEQVGVNRCPSCNGTKEAFIGKVKHLCPTCDGTGVWYPDPEPEIKNYVEAARREIQRIEYEALVRVRM